MRQASREWNVQLGKFAGFTGLGKKLRRSDAASVPQTYYVPTDEMIADVMKKKSKAYQVKKRLLVFVDLKVG